jgi:Rho GDP-dissociation inhibitor
MAQVGEEDLHDDEVTPGYKPPAEKSLDDIIKTDADDESLQRYKEQLLGASGGAGGACKYPENPKQVIVEKMSLLVEGRPDIEVDLTGKLILRNESMF